MRKPDLVRFSQVALILTEHFLGLQRMYKIIVRLTTMDYVATTQSLCENLQNLATFAATVQGNIDKIHEVFD